MIVILFLLSMLFLFFYLVTRKYKKESFEDCDQKEHPLVSLYPTVLFIYEKLQFKRLAKKEQRSKMAWKLLAVKGEEQFQFERYVLKKMSFVLVLLFSMTFLAMCVKLSSLQSARQLAKGIVNRPDGTASQEWTLAVMVEQEGRQQRDEVTFKIQPQKEFMEETASETLEKEDEQRGGQQEEYQKAYRYLDEVLLNQNRELTQIGSDLCFPDAIPDTKLQVIWRTEPESLIDSVGRVHNETLEKEMQVELCATIYGETGKELGTYQVSVTVIPLKEYQYEGWKADLEATIQKVDEETAGESVLKLPTEFEGRQLTWEGEVDNTAWYLLLFGGVIGVLVYIAMDEELQNKVKVRKKQMLKDYPDIINKLTLLIAAGMTVPGAWERIVTDYVKISFQRKETKERNGIRKKKKKEEKRYAYEEMLTTNYELRLGVSELKAFEDFGRRTGVVEYLKLSSALIQNMKKGAEGLTQILDLMAAEAFENRKQRAKQLGEEAGTKLLMPMMLMLILVLIIIMVPAFWSMQI